MSFINTVIDSVIVRIFPDWSLILKKDLEGCQSVLDLGCGFNSALRVCKISYSVGVDNYEPYLIESKKRGIHKEYIKADINTFVVAPKSFDAVILLNVFEHLDKENAYSLMYKMEMWAKKKVIIMTTNGFLDQDAYDGNPLQIHHSGWTVKEFETQGYKVNGVYGWKPLRGYRGEVKINPAFLGYVLSETTQKITYHIPNLSFLLYAVKDIK